MLRNYKRILDLIYDRYSFFFIILSALLKKFDKVIDKYTNFIETLLNISNTDGTMS